MSDNAANLAEAMTRVHLELPKLERDRTVEVRQKNGDTYSYSYVTLANLSDAILPLLAKHGLTFIAMPGAGSDGKMALSYVLRHVSGDELRGEFPLSAEGGIQQLGGRITYARRYCLAALVGVAADEDDESRLSEDGGPRTAQRAPRAPAAPGGGNAGTPSGRTAQRAQRSPRGAAPALPDEDPGGPVGTDQHRKMRALWRDLGYDGDEQRETRLSITARILGLPDLESSSDLTRAEADTVIAALIERKERTAQAAGPDGGEG